MAMEREPISTVFSHLRLSSKLEHHSKFGELQVQLHFSTSKEIKALAICTLGFNNDITVFLLGENDVNACKCD